MRSLSFGGLAGPIFGIPTPEFKKGSIGEQGRGALGETSEGSEEARMEKGGNRGGVARPSRPPARGTDEGMEPDDLLCSRNARPQKALVGRAQWKITQPHP